jgi:hypothetical protein
LDVLNLITIIGSIIFFVRYRQIQYEIYDNIDKSHQTQDDFTVLIENIPIMDFKEGSTLLMDKKKIEFDYEQELKSIVEVKIHKWIDWMEEQTQ